MHPRMEEQVRTSAVKIIPQKDESITIEVFKTRNYKKFVLAKENRPVYEKHVTKLEKSLADHGFLPDSPIRVVREGDMLMITDGQHRFRAAQNLGIEVLYVFSREDSPFEDIQIHHTYQKGWNYDDYVHHYMSRGFPDYVRLSNLAKEYKMPHSALIDLINLGIGATRGTFVSRAGLKTGDLKLSAENETVARILLDRVNEIRFLHERLKPIASDQRFLRALGICLAHRDYDHERMLAALSRQLMSVISCGTVDDYLAMLSDIYNHKRQADNRIFFQRAGSKTLPIS